ncbi:MAG: hypothetical protein K2X87_06265 [Gemmataceae bacterium]|nr:hypothetical protein [Gemmataceae bacterium]
MARSIPRTRPLTLEEFEGRNLLTGRPLPFLVAGQPPDVFATYGQYSFYGGQHFHEGTGFVGPSGTTVNSVENGIVINVNSTDPILPKRFISIKSSPAHGWDYLHAQPQINPLTGLVYAKSDTVEAGKNGSIAKISPFYADGTGRPDHLHLEALPKPRNRLENRG